jgi:hypothetical protein
MMLLFLSIRIYRQEQGIAIQPPTAFDIFSPSRPEGFQLSRFSTSIVWVRLERELQGPKAKNSHTEPTGGLVI